MHMLKCCEMTLPEDEVGDPTREQFLVQLVIKAKVANPGHPIPIKTVKEGELEITFPPSPKRSEGEISLEMRYRTERPGNKDPSRTTVTGGAAGFVTQPGLCL